MYASPVLPVNFQPHQKQRASLALLVLKLIVLLPLVSFAVLEPINHWMLILHAYPVQLVITLLVLEHLLAFLVLLVILQYLLSLHAQHANLDSSRDRMVLRPVQLVLEISSPT